MKPNVDISYQFRLWCCSIPFKTLPLKKTCSITHSFIFWQPFYTNTLFLLSLVVLTTFTLVLILLPIGPLADFFQVSIHLVRLRNSIKIPFSRWPPRFQVMRISWNPLTDPFKFGDDDLYPFRAYVLLLVALHFLVSLFIEELVSGRQFSKTANPSAHSNRNVYKRVERQVDSDHTWPPLSSTTPTEVLSLWLLCVSNMFLVHKL